MDSQCYEVMLSNQHRDVPFLVVLAPSSPTSLHLITSSL